MGRAQGQREGVNPAVATAAALGSVAAATVAILGFVVGIFDGEDDGSANPEPTAASAPSPNRELTGASAPVVNDWGYIPPSTVFAKGVSGPVSGQEAIYMFARRLENGEVLGSTPVKLSQDAKGEDVLHWRASLHAATLGAAVKSGDGFDVVGAVVPKVSSQSPAQSYGSASANASTGGIDLDDAVAVSAPRTVVTPEE